MSISVKAISNHPAFRIITVLPLSLLILVTAELSGKFAANLLQPKSGVHDFLSMALFMIFLAFYSILASFGLSRGKINSFGYQKTETKNVLKVLLPVLVAELVTSMPILIFPLTGNGHFANNWSFWQNVIGVWILASSAEELLCRGVVQSYLKPVKKFKMRIFRIEFTVPVIISAFIFMLMHIPLIFGGMDKILYSSILVSTFTLGIIAGYFREKTGSLLPAIVAHSFANISGFTIGSLIELIK